MDPALVHCGVFYLYGVFRHFFFFFEPDTPLGDWPGRPDTVSVLSPGETRSSVHWPLYPRSTLSPLKPARVFPNYTCLSRFQAYARLSCFRSYAQLSRFRSYAQLFASGLTPGSPTSSSTSGSPASGSTSSNPASGSTPSSSSYGSPPGYHPFLTKIPPLPPANFANSCLLSSITSYTLPFLIRSAAGLHALCLIPAAPMLTGP